MGDLFPYFFRSRNLVLKAAFQLKVLVFGEARDELKESLIVGPFATQSIIKEGAAGWSQGMPFCCVDLVDLGCRLV